MKGVTLAGAMLMGLSRVAWPGEPVACSIEMFSANPAEHIVNELKHPVQVRQAKGTVRSAAGAWPEGVQVQVELVGLVQGLGRRSATADIHGNFSIPEVKPGEYCFRAMAIGWQSVLGRLIVSPSAPQAAVIELTLELGV